MRCPGCFSLMTRVEEAGVHLATCPECFGTLIRRMALMKCLRSLAKEAMDRTPEQALAAQRDIAELAATVVESDTKKTLRCNDCNLNMHKERLHPMIPVTIDRCPKCENAWMDVGEFSLLKRLYVELMCSTDPEIVQRREKLAVAMAEFAGRDRDALQQQAASITTGVDILSSILGGF